MITTRSMAADTLCEVFHREEIQNHATLHVLGAHLHVLQTTMAHTKFYVLLLKVSVLFNNDNTIVNCVAFGKMRKNKKREHQLEHTIVEAIKAERDKYDQQREVASNADYIEAVVTGVVLVLVSIASVLIMWEL